MEVKIPPERDGQLNETDKVCLLKLLKQMTGRFMQQSSLAIGFA